MYLSDEATFATNDETVEMISMAEEMAPGCLIECSYDFQTMKDAFQLRHMGKDLTAQALRHEVQHYCRGRAGSIRYCGSIVVELRRHRVQEGSEG